MTSIRASFSTSSSGLTASDSGTGLTVATPSILRGTFLQANGQATDQSNGNDLAVWDLGDADQEVYAYLWNVATAGGEAGHGNERIYFRVQDANNWLALRHVRRDGAAGSPTGYFVSLEKSVGGVTSIITQWSAGITPVAELRVRALADSVTPYWRTGDLNAALAYGYTQTVTLFNTATKAGFGGGPGNQGDAQDPAGRIVDGWGGDSLATAPYTPSIIAPGNGESVDLAVGGSITYRSSNVNPRDPETKVAVRRKVGAGSYEWWNGTAWTASETYIASTVLYESGADKGKRQVTFPASQWALGTTYNVSLSSQSSKGTNGPYSSDITLTVRSAPVAGLYAPSGTVDDTDRPTVRWSYSQAQGRTQAAYDVRIYNALLLPVGVDPDTLPPYKSFRGTGTTQDWTPPDALSNAGSYVAVVQVTSQDGQTSAWERSNFAVNVAGPQPWDVTAVYDEPTNSVLLAGRGRDNRMTADQASAETTLAWEPVSNATVTRDGSYAKVGAQAVKSVATTAGDMTIRTTGIPVDAGEPTTVMAHVAASGGVPRAAELELTWRDADGNVLSTAKIDGQELEPSTGGGDIGGGDTGGGTGGSSPHSTRRILVSDSADRSASRAADASLVAGDAFFFLDDPTDVSLVTWWINQPFSGSSFRSDTSAPFDLVGGSPGSASPLDSTAYAGAPLVVRARVTFSDNTTQDVTATATVWSPASLPALEAWYEADSVTSAGVSPSAGAAVSSWTDLSGRGRTFSQGTSGKRPVMAVVNGKPAVRFDGVDDALDAASLPINGLTALSIGFVGAARTDYAGGGNNNLAGAAVFWNETGSWGQTGLVVRQRGVNARFGTGQVGNYTLNYSRPQSIGPNVSVTVARHNGPTASDDVLVDGAATPGIVTGRTATLASNQSTVTLGHGGNDGAGGGDVYGAYDMQGVVVCSAVLSAADNALLNRWWRAKYKLATQTPYVPPVDPPPSGGGEGGTGSEPGSGGLGNYYDGRFGTWGTGGITVNPGQSVQAAVNAAAPNSIIWVKNGTYREEVTLTKSGIKLVGESQNARITGSDLVNPSWWVNNGDGRWYYQDPWNKRGYISDVFETPAPDYATRIPDQLHRDNVPVMHRANLGLVSGELIDWATGTTNLCQGFLDGSGRYYIGSDPSGHTFERATRRYVIKYAPGAESCLLYNLSLDHSQTAIQEGGVTMGKGWTIEDCRLIGHHGRALDLNINCTVKGSVAPYTGAVANGSGAFSAVGQPGSMVIDWVGATGISGEYPHIDTSLNSQTDNRAFSDNIKILRTEIKHHNYARNMFTDEAGGIKYVLHHDTLVDEMWIHDGLGMGVWFDYDNYRFQVSRSVIERNQGGVMYEVNTIVPGETARVNNCTIRKNGALGTRPGEPAWSNATSGYNPAAGIHSNFLNSSTMYVEFDHNDVEMEATHGYGVVARQDNREGGRFSLAGYRVHDNYIKNNGSACLDMGGESSGSPAPSYTNNTRVA